MKVIRKCHHASAYDDSLCHMAEVNKGARKIMTDAPYQLTLMFLGIVLTGVFIFVVMVVTYLMFGLTTIPPPIKISRNERSLSTVEDSDRKFCPLFESKELNLLNKLGYTSTDRLASPLMTLDTTVDDVHYVFGDVPDVPWSSVCSLESTLRAVKNDSRVHVFIVRGIKNEDNPRHDSHQHLRVSLSASLNRLTEAYGVGLLNVVRVTLDECLEKSPLVGVDLSKRPGLAKFAVQLTVLWQFGGTVLDASVTAVDDRVYRARGTAVEYGVRTFSAPAACHAFVFDAILCAKSYAAHPERRRLSFGPYVVWRVWNATVDQTGRAGRPDQARPVPRGTVCRGDPVPDGCYYVENEFVDGGDAPLTAVVGSRRDYCPTMSAIG